MIRSFLVMLLLLSLPGFAQQRKTLSAALRDGQCKLQCIESGRAAGQVLQANVRNVSTQPLLLSLPEGALLVPFKPEEQTRMVIEEELLELPPGGEKTVAVDGVCVEYGKPVPAAGPSPQPYLVTCPSEKPPGTPWAIFLQSDGIPPSRFSPTILDKVVACAKIPDQARELQHAGKLHNDLGPRHLVTVIQRAVWTVCAGHDRAKIREDIHTQVRKSGGSQTDEQVNELSDNLWADVDLVTKNIPISSTPEQPERVADLDIHPIQVVQEPLYEELKEDIPLVGGKATAVRVFVRKALQGNHTLRLTWIAGSGLQQDSIDAELITYEKRTWVLPLAPRSGPGHDVLKGTFADLNNHTRPDPEADIPSVRAKKSLENKADTYWAFNFTFGAGRPCPSDTLTLTADLFNAAGNVVASRTETSAADFSICHVVKPYNIVVTAARTKNQKFTGNGSAAWLAAAANTCKEQLLAVFPLGPGDIALTIDPIPPTGIPVIEYADRVAGPFSTTRAVEGRFPNADGIFIIAPRNFQTGAWPFDSVYDGFTPAATDKVHYLDEILSFAGLVAAHEKGHDGALLGSSHPSGGPIQDAWDAGCHSSPQRMPESKTMKGRGWLMQQAREGVASSVLNFIEQSEYKKLLRKLTDWGSV